jgi:hypothetical protein
VLLCIAQAALAQAPATASSVRPPGEVSGWVRYGKWGAAAAFAVLTATGAALHEQANTDYARLTVYCRDVGPCDIGADGRYADPAPEALYQDVIHADRAARGLLIGGQVALAGAVTLFILELREKKAPRDIPLEPYVAGSRGSTLLGVRVPARFRP